MHDDPVLGALTEADRNTARRALDAAGHAWDLRAAVLSTVDAADLRRFDSVLRGGPAQPDEWHQARRSGGPADDAQPWHDSAEWQQVLTDVVRGSIAELVCVEFTPEGVGVVKVTADESGIPRQTQAGSTEWGSVAPLLSPRPDIRRFQLAGGVGRLPAAGREEFDAAVAGWLREYLPASRTSSIVLVKRHPGWVLLDRAAALLRAGYSPRAEIGLGPADPSQRNGTHRADTADLVRALSCRAPLRVDHTLLLARVDWETGAVHAHPHVLFPAGARVRPGQITTAEVTVHGGFAGRLPVVLPVLAGTPAPDGTQAVLLSAPQTAVGAFTSARLTFVLRGPGEVGLLSAGEASNDPATKSTCDDSSQNAPLDLPTVIRRFPHRVVRPPATEVFVTVEMSGAETAEAVERLAFARRVIDSLARRHGSGQGIRIGVVGYYDHVIRENDFTPRPVLLRQIPAGPAPATLTELTTWRPERRAQDTVSSLEDALSAVVRLATGRAGGARARGAERIVLIVGRRPPGLPKQFGVVPSCPRGADWRADLDTLRSRGVRVMARVDPVAQTGPPGNALPGPAQRYTAAAWAALSADGSFRPGTDTADDVAEALAPGWRWDGPPCRLAFTTPPP